MSPDENDNQEPAADAPVEADTAQSADAEGGGVDAAVDEPQETIGATAEEATETPGGEPVATTESDNGDSESAAAGSAMSEAENITEDDTASTGDNSGDNADEAGLRQELGIGNAKIEVNQQVIDDLLQGAVVGYEQIFADTVLGADGLARDYGVGLPANADATPVQENLSLLRDVHMNVKVELGRGHMYLKDILRLGQGSVVELERLAGDPLDIYVNEKVIARGEVLVLNENFCIRITEIFNPADVLKE